MHFSTDQGVQQSNGLGLILNSMIACMQDMYCNQETLEGITEKTIKYVNLHCSC